MTFIASVIARDGVALVADSFVTTPERSLEEDKLIEFVTKRGNKRQSVTFTELGALFERRPSYTRNYMDKLVQFGRFSAVTTTGQAYINKKLIKDIVIDIATKMDVDSASYNTKTIDEILQQFCDLIKIEVTEHLKTRPLSNTSFIFSHYNNIEDKPQIFNIIINEAAKDQDISKNADAITFADRSYLKIVTDGQDTFVDRLIFGSLYRKAYDVKQIFKEYVVKKLKPKKEKKNEIIDCIDHIDFLRDTVQADIFSIQFRELSLQEAVDLASLLMKIVMDIQVYTEKIPTVGGLIRLAVIKKGKGFDWISGHEIIKPRIIY